MCKLISVRKINNLTEMCKPAGAFIRRDATILRSVVNGVPYLQASLDAKLSLSHTRIVAQHVAFRLLKEARLIDPTIPLQYRFKLEEFTSNAGVWNQRLDDHLAAVIDSLNHA